MDRTLGEWGRKGRGHWVDGVEEEWGETCPSSDKDISKVKSSDDKHIEDYIRSS